MANPTVPCSQGEAVSPLFILEGPLWWRRNDQDVWHRLEIVEDTQNPGLYGLKNTATAMNVE